MISANRRHAAPDGVALAYDAHVPTRGHRVPTVVMRTPYGRSRHLEEGRGWVRRGFAFVVADVRGRYDSDGAWRPYRDERADGAALIDLITAQPWSDGRVVVMGGSYSGYTAWAMAVERPDAVAAIVSLGPSMSLARTKFSPAGMLRLAEHAAWWVERGDARTSRDGLSALLFREQPEVLGHLPVLQIADRLGPDLPGWGRVVASGPGDLNGEEITDAELAAIRVPSFHVGGWHDLLLSETLHHWEGVGDESTPKRLLIGPWLHELVFSSSARVGALNHGASSRVDWAEELVLWVRAALDGDLPARRVDTFVTTGRDGGWRRGTAWPPPGRTVEALLGSGSFVTDLRDPFPSRAEAMDRRPLLARDDAVRLAVDVPPGSIEGVPVVEFRAAAEVAEADWIVRLLLILPADDAGPVVEVAVGEATTGSEAACRVQLSAVSIDPPPGSRMLLEISGSDMPRLARATAMPNRYSVAEADLPHPFRQTVDDVRLFLPVATDRVVR